MNFLTLRYTMKRMWHFEKLSFCIPTKNTKLISQLTRNRRRLFCSDSSNDGVTLKHQINPKPKIKLKSIDINPIYDGEDIDSRQKEKENALQYNKNIQAAIYATKLGAVANLALASTKGMAGVMVSSTALIAGNPFIFISLLLKFSFKSCSFQMLQTVSVIFFAMQLSTTL